MDHSGQTIGKYKLIQRLGQGGMAQVYKAIQPTIDRPVAIKIMHGHLAENEDFLVRFKREARGMGLLRHPNIVSILDFDNDGDRDLYVANGMLSARSAQDYCTTFWRHDIRDGISTETLLMQEVYNRCMKGLGKEVSWNGYEHNALLLNEGEGLYLNVGYLMGVGFEFDSRSVVASDLDGDGRTDLIVVQMDQLTNRHGTGRRALR